MATVMRLQLAFPQNHVVAPDTYNRLIHDARHHHGVSGRHANGRRAFELSGAVDDRRARYGVSATECVRILDLSVWRAAALFQLYRRGRAVGAAGPLPMWAGSRMHR